MKMLLHDEFYVKKWGNSSSRLKAEASLPMFV